MTAEKAIKKLLLLLALGLTVYAGMKVTAKIVKELKE